MVYRRTHTVDANGDHEYSKMNLTTAGGRCCINSPVPTIVVLVCGMDETQLTDSSGDIIALPI